MITRSEQAQAQAYLDHQADVAAEYVPTSKRIKPTPAQIAVRDELAHIGHLEEYDATRMIVHRLDKIDEQIAAGVSVEEIACEIVIKTIIGVENEKEQQLRDYLATQPNYKEALRNFHYMDGVEKFGW